MNVELEEISKSKDEIFLNVLDKDLNTDIGIIFSVGNHIAYEIKPEFRGSGAATDALKIITSRIKSPILEIKYNNIASKKVALKAGYKLVRLESPFEIYEYTNNACKNK